ncbi:MAG: hypothetical protein ACKVX7_17495 [Planctomycetota bacterium]
MTSTDDRTGARNFQWFVGSALGVLLVVAIATTWLAPGAADLSRWLPRAMIWVVLASLLLFGWRRATTASPRCARVLAVTALFALVAYSNFGRFHGEGRFCHTHELYHYAIGGKYFRELGYDGLYAATARALVEIDARHGDHITIVKNLRTYRLENLAVTLRRGEEFAAHFSPARWAEFRDDIQTFNRRLSPGAWQRILADHGFNATPFWAALGGALLRIAPISDATLLWLALIDPLLLLCACVWLLRAFSFAHVALFVAMWAADLFAPFTITGGAYLRQLWLCATVAFVVAMQRGRAGAAGFWLAIAALDRVFPLLFGIWPLTRWIIEIVVRRRFGSSTARFPLALVVSGVLCIGASSIAVGGIGSWVRFFENIETHQASFFTNQIALRSVFVIDPVAAASARANPWDESQWLRDKATLDGTARVPLAVLRGVLALALVVLIGRQRQFGNGLALSLYLPYVLLYPASYYYGFLQLAALFWRPGENRVALSLCLFQLVMTLAQARWPDALELEWVHWLASVGVGFVLIDALTFFGRRRSGRVVLSFALTGVLVAVLLVALPRSRDAVSFPIVSDLIAADVVASSGARVVTERLEAWGPHWSLDDHVLALVDAPGGAVSWRFESPGAPRGRLRLALTTTPAFGRIRIDWDDQRVAEVDLYSARVDRIEIVCDDVNFAAGPHVLTVTSIDKHPASAGFHFGVDRLTLEATSRARPDRREAMRVALNWLLTHPADRFDGGAAAVAGEILALQEILAQPAWSEFHALCRGGIAARAAAQIGAKEQATLGALERELIDDRRLLRTLGADVNKPEAPAITEVFFAVSAEALHLSDWGRKTLPSELQDADYWRQLCAHALRWAAELHSENVRLRALLLAQCLGVAEQLSVADAELSAFLATQNSDGSFEPGTLATRPDARRELVEAALMVLARAP